MKKSVIISAIAAFALMACNGEKLKQAEDRNVILGDSLHVALANQDSLFCLINEINDGMEQLKAMENILTDLLEKSISTFDSDESFYHGYLLSMLTGFPSYGARANREEGDGSPDIVLYPRKPRDPAYIFELKVRKKYNRMADGLSEAYDQIETRRYEDGILDDGYAGVVSFAICFCKKSCIAGLYTHR